MAETQSLNEKDKISYLSKAKKYGIKSTKYFTLTIFLTGLLNTIFLIISIIKFQTIESTAQYLISLLTVLVIGILITIAGLYLTYKYLLIDGIKVIYESLTPFFQRLSSLLIDKTSDLIANKTNIGDQHIEKAFKTGNIIAEVYGNKTPKLVKKGASLIVKQLPFTELIGEAKNCLKDRDKEKASDLLFVQIDNYVKSSIIGNNSMKFLYWLLPLNIAIQYVTIYMLSQHI